MSMVSPEEADTTIGTASVDNEIDQTDPMERVQSHVLRSMDPSKSLMIFFRITNVIWFRRFLGILRLKESTPPPPPLRGINGPELSPAPEGAPIRIEFDVELEKRFLQNEFYARQIWSEAEARTEGQDRESRRAYSWNIAFTWTGLEALGVNASTLESFPEDFKEGMAARALRLIDVGESRPERWDSWLGSRQVHGVLLLNHRIVPIEKVSTVPVVDFGKLIDSLAKAATAAFGFRILHQELGEKIHRLGPNGLFRIEHFGFRDGVSQPFSDVGLAPPPVGGGTARPGGTWDPIALGELLLGRRDEDGLIQDRPIHPLLRDNGAYMVFRKLRQDVIGFRRFLRQHDDTAGPDSRLAAQMVGRWPNGASLVTTPDIPIDELSLPDRLINDFRYHDGDPRGQRCPLGAHARRANPRDSNNRDEARRHRIWRRSITYGGPFLDYGADDDGEERGLLFVAMCARIDQQFEFLQTRWLNGGEFIGQAGIARCPLTGANDGDVQDSFSVANRPAPYSHLPRFVTTRGGDYFFVPSIPAISAIANGETFDTGAAIVENPSIDSTPRTLEPEVLFRIGRDKLLPPALNVWWNHNGIILVGRQTYVRDVLKHDGTFALSDHAARIRQITGNEDLLLSLKQGDPERQRRIDMLRDAIAALRDPVHHRPVSPAALADAIVARAMQALLARHGPAGRLDVARDVALIVPMALARGYFGINGPDYLSPGYVASLFNKLEISQVPRDWLAVLPHVPPQDVPFATMVAWIQIAFAHVFLNIVDARELAALALRTTGEFFRHVDKLVVDGQMILPPKSTLLGCLLRLNPSDYGINDAARFRVVVRLLLVELMIGGTGTLVEALPNVINYLLDHPDILDKAVDAAKANNDVELDRIINEVLRFDPVAPILFRRCEKSAQIGGVGPKVPKGRMVAVLLKTAMFEDNYFPNPDTFSTDPAARPPDRYLLFGYGDHACRGIDIATVTLRRMIKAIVMLPNLRRAAGPLGYRTDSLDRCESLLVRFND